MAKTILKEKINKMNDDLEIINCDYCGSEQNSTILVSKDYVYNSIPGSYNIVQCKDCNLVFTNPRMKKDLLKTHYYNTDDFGSPIEKNSLEQQKSVAFNKKVLSNYFNYPFDKKSMIYKITHYPLYLKLIREIKRTFLIPPYVSHGKILEIGCSYGSYLYQLKRIGWNVKGIELSKKASNYCNNSLNIEVLNIDLLDFTTEEKFDIIYIRMVLEHLESPKLALKKLNELLKQKGHLILVLPDFTGFEVRLYKKYAYTLQVPYHLYHFTPETIKNYLKMFNFKKIKIYHQKFDRDLIAPLKFIIQENPKNNLARFLLRISTKKLIRQTIIKSIINTIAWFGKSSRMTITAQRAM